MKFFIGQRVTGEDRNQLREEVKNVVSILEEKGHSGHCTILIGDSFEAKSRKQVMEHAFRELDSSDAFLVIIRSEEKSEGLLMEIGYVLGNNKKIILCIKEDVKNTYIREIVDNIIEFSDIDNLYDKLKEAEL